MTAEIDHLVIAAATLADGVRWCEATLGVVPAAGGRHALMGTHNRLVNLSSPAFPRCYLELIALDPDAPPPGRPRWFGLDALDLRSGPRLIHAVARSTALESQRRALIDRGFDPGAVLAAHRDTPAGRLQWQIAVRDDGRLDAGGALLTLIQWGAAHPTDTLPDQGVQLQTLALHGLPVAAQDALQLRGVQLQPAAPPALRAVLATPAGERRLDA